MPVDLVTAIRNIPAVRVRALPRPPDADAEIRQPASDPYGMARRAALASVFHAGENPLLWAWHRDQVGGSVELLSAGGSALPAEAVTESLDAGALWDRLDRFGAWTILSVWPGDPDESTQDDAAGQVRPSIETGLLAARDDAFALLVLAQPASQMAIEAAMVRVIQAGRFSAQRQGTAPEHALRYERLRARLAELRRGRAEGLWQLRVTVGAADADSVRILAGVAAASLDINDLPYDLTPAGSVCPLSQAIEAAPAMPALDPDAVELAPELVSSRMVAALTRPPSVEVPGVRLVNAPQFDVTPEHSVPDPIRFGQILDAQSRPAGLFGLTRSSLNRHVFVCGATGSGKSQTVRGLLTELSAAKIPWLVVEPAKAEYRRMAARLPDAQVIVIRPGDPERVPVGIDPLRPAAGFPLQTHIDLVRALFLASFQAVEPFPQILAAALQRTYERFGWNVATGEPQPGWQPIYPTLADLQATALQVIDEVGYGQEIRDNVTGFIRVRLASLQLGTTGRFVHRSCPISIAELLQRNVVLEIEDVGDDRDKAFLMGVVLIALTEHLRVVDKQQPSTVEQLRHVTVFEEAHRLLRRAESQDGGSAVAQAVEMFAALLAEVRAYGEGVVIAEQIPSKLIPDVVKNTAVKVMHRLPAADDRETVGATMNLNKAQSEYVVSLPPGEAAVFTDAMDHAIRIRLPDGTSAEAGPAQLSEADIIAAPRNGRCGADYGLGRASLSLIAAGQALIERSPDVSAWVELSVVAYLIAMAAPAPTEPVRTTIVANGQTGDVALIDAIDQAVAARVAGIADRMNPADFAEFLAGELRAAIAGQPPSENSYPQWWARPFMWDVAHAELRLLRNERSHDLAVRRQLADVQEARRRARNLNQVQQVIYGDGRPCTLERISGSRRGDHDWAEAVNQLGEMFGVPWVAPYLDIAHRVATSPTGL